MKQSISFVSQLVEKFPAPDKPNILFSAEDISAFEVAIGTELPSDYYEFLQVYGFGCFSDYFYVLNPFGENGAEIFMEETRQRHENYVFLERDYQNAETGGPHFVDGEFRNGKFAVTGGSERLAEFLRVEKIDSCTRSKIIALGDHYPYPFYPEKGGLIFWGYTDDEEFFIKNNGDKTSVVLYSDGYYEFDMTITEFMYSYLTCALKLPMMNEDNNEWEFIPYNIR